MLITFLFSLFESWEIIPKLVDIFWIIKQMLFVYIFKKLILQKKNDLVSGLTSSIFFDGLQTNHWTDFCFLKESQF